MSLASFNSLRLKKLIEDSLSTAIFSAKMVLESGELPERQTLKIYYVDLIYTGFYTDS
jgi:hypothetical protein